MYAYQILYIYGEFSHDIKEKDVKDCFVFSPKDTVRHIMKKVTSLFPKVVTKGTLKRKLK